MPQCFICGKTSAKFIFKNILEDQLVKDWQINKATKHKFNLRESLICPSCGCSRRIRGLAQAISRFFTFTEVKTFDQWIDKASKVQLRVAEINFCGNLHTFLTKLPGLSCSQYYEPTLRAKIFNFLKGIRQENITNLTYKDNSFDLVLHSEVLEHVSDVDKALLECKRVIKPSGVCLFTIPIIWKRKTLRRAKLSKNSKKITYLKPPSYHGSGEPDFLVYWEFGGDFITKNKLKVAFEDPQSLLYVFALTK